MEGDDERCRSAEDFALLVRRYQAAIDAGSSVRAEFLCDIFSLLAELIRSAVRLPEPELNPVDEYDEASTISPMNAAAVETSHDQWARLYHRLKGKLGDADPYSEVFDPIQDKHIVSASLANDLADIYRDLTEGLPLLRKGKHDDALFEWRLGFVSHWGKHATDALKVILWRIECERTPGSKQCTKQ